jgi:hypothetical protein
MEILIYGGYKNHQNSKEGKKKKVCLTNLPARFREKYLSACFSPLLN